MDMIEFRIMWKKENTTKANTKATTTTITTTTIIASIATEGISPGSTIHFILHTAIRRWARAGIGHIVIRGTAVPVSDSVWDSGGVILPTGARTVCIRRLAMVTITPSVMAMAAMAVMAMAVMVMAEITTSDSPAITNHVVRPWVEVRWPAIHVV